MKCPFCQGDELRVTDSREAADTNAIRRRRECTLCGKRFTTFETVELTMQVKKRDGSFEDFQQRKLISGLAAACSHTTVSHERVIGLSAKITAELLEMQDKEVTTELIGDIVMKYLKDMDLIAYIRFACVYRRFKEFSELVDEIKEIQSMETNATESKGGMT